MGLQEIFINNLRSIRKEKKITQEKLAELCNTETSYIGQIEIGKRFPSISLIEKIALALDIPAYILFMEKRDCVITDKNLQVISANVTDYVYREISRAINNQVSVSVHEKNDAEVKN